MDKKEEKNNKQTDNKEEIGKLRKELEETKKLAEERLNNLKYMQADFENYQKKFDKEKEHIINLANEGLIKELITVLDDFDASINSLGEKDRQGIELLRKKFFKILEKHGLCEIEALGKKFSPHFHEALCKECSDKEEDEIIGEIQKGYILKSKVIRPSKVKVAKKKVKEDNKEEKIRDTQKDKFK
jgi:molecular chaperone GrpE